MLKSNNMRNLFLIILITLGSVLVNAQNLVLPLYGKAEFEKIASLDDERDSLSARRESLWQNG